MAGDESNLTLGLFADSWVVHRRRDDRTETAGRDGFCNMGKKAEAMEALTKAWQNGYRNNNWVRRDADLAPLRGDPEFEKLYPEEGGTNLEVER